MKMKFILFTMVLSLLALPAWASAEQGTKDEAMAMALKAAAYVREVGVEKALNSFNTEGQWEDRDLYVAAVNGEGVSVANSHVPAMIGKNLIDLKDVDGKYFVREFLSVQDTGWVTYKWPNPITKKVVLKNSYVVRVGKMALFVGAYE